MACANAVFALALSEHVPATGALGVSALLYFITLRRFIAQMRDEPRPRWITRWFDEPLFVHFGASTLALLLSPVCALLALAVAAWRGSLGHLGFEYWRLSEGYAYAFGLLTSVWAIWIERRFVRIRRMTVVIAGLPPEFEGYRIAQLSDLHVGSFDPKARALEWVAMSNALEPDLVAVTGDLVTSGRGFYRDVAEALGALRATDGVFVSMGNHDQSNNDELTRLVAEHGPTVLRNSSQVIRRGAASLNVAGIDGRIATAPEVTRTVQECAPNAPVVLLAHYPWTFSAAAAAGADLILTGHTHGGQLGVPFLSQRFNLARLTGQRSRGLVHSGKTAMYVNAGLGTTGPPMRLAVPPEIALITLRRA
ncbi:MAG: metallophosphoesterase [Pseudomonadota bacterium]